MRTACGAPSLPFCLRQFERATRVRPSVNATGRRSTNACISARNQQETSDDKYRLQNSYIVHSILAKLPLLSRNSTFSGPNVSLFQPDLICLGPSMKVTCKQICIVLHLLSSESDFFCRPTPTRLVVSLVVYSLSL